MYVMTASEEESLFTVLRRNRNVVHRGTMQTKMIADMNFNYAGRPLKPGDDFFATENDALALRAYRRAHDADGEATLAVPKKSRRYRRRDMQAEDTQ